MDMCTPAHCFLPWNYDVVGIECVINSLEMVFIWEIAFNWNRLLQRIEKVTAYVALVFKHMWRLTIRENRTNKRINEGKFRFPCTNHREGVHTKREKAIFIGCLETETNGNAQSQNIYFVHAFQTNATLLLLIFQFIAFLFLLVFFSRSIQKLAHPILQGLWPLQSAQRMSVP